MCGRYTLTKPLKNIETHFSPVISRTGHRGRYNNAPTQILPVIILLDSRREMVAMRWGLIPSWSRDKNQRSPLINARGETLLEKPSFKDSFKARRCLVPADGFIEWKKQGSDKVPYYIYLKSGELFAFAGIWAEWQGGGETIRSYSIITTAANDFLNSIHHRMPVLLPARLYQEWLDPKADPGSLLEYLQPFASDLMAMREISKIINSVKNDSPDCLLPPPPPSP